MQLDKEQLKKKLASYSSEIKSQKNAIEEDGKAYWGNLKESYKDSLELLDKGKYVALGLGALFVIYKMISWVWESPEPIREGDDEPKIIVIDKKEPFIVRSIKRAIASFILSIAKKELNLVLEKLKKQREEKK